jgi:serine/threonine protein phosphatase PrpC
MTGEETTCPHCAAPAGLADRFCESCGGPLFEVAPPQVHRVAIPRGGPSLQGPCTDCGNAGFADGYCTACGHRRVEPDRDEATLGVIALITDRGLHHARNEDAAAAGMLSVPDSGRPPAIAVAVCDGVSSSGEPQMASAAASKGGVEAMLAALAASGEPRAAVLAGLAEAASAAARAGTGVDPGNAPSCTYTAATVVTNARGHVQITVGNVGDSRAYWLPEPPAPARQLTLDDSVAQELMTAGASAESEFVLRGAHTITRWLGADAGATPWSETSVQTVTVDGPGSLLLCSDGLWNYLPDADDLARFCSGTDPMSAVRALTEHALEAGGQDNVTVVVVPIGGVS